MAGSRLDRIGTIFSRATGLIKAGGIKYQDRPLWYDIYRVFPPKYEPHIDRQPEKQEVFEIMYHEDKFRALFFKKFGMNPGGIARNLGDRNSEDPSQMFVNACLKLKRENLEWSDNQIFDAALESYRPPSYSLSRAHRDDQLGDVVAEMEASKRHGRRPPTISAQSLLSLFKEAKEKQSQNESESGSSNTNDTGGEGDNKQK